MVVENSAEEYVNTLNEIKQSFKQENIDKGIIGMRSTKEGKLLITFEKNEDLKNKISSTLVNEKSNGKRIRLLNDEKMETIYIRGMDATAKKEEVLEALDLYVENFYHKTYRLSELRPMANDRQAVTLTINEKDALKLLEYRFIMVGFVRCYMERRLNISRCGKCWEYGHGLEACHGTDRTKACYRCGKTGHERINCTQEEYCPLCGINGHIAGTSKCSVFRHQLSKAKRVERQTSRGPYSHLESVTQPVSYAPQ